jgi:hypothetical protein
MKLWIPATLLLALIAGRAHAGCDYPRAPDKVPDGNTATLEEMITAKKGFDKYNVDMNAYLKCMEESINGIMPADTSKMPEEEKTKLTNQQKVETQKHDAAVEELEAAVGHFNEQLRAYKAKQAKK